MNLEQQQSDDIIKSRTYALVRDFMCGIYRKMEQESVNASTPVPTSKPRINSNIDPQLYELLCFFIALRREKNISYSQSKAIEECCNAFLSLGKERIEKICRLAEADLRSPSDYAQLLLKQALDEIEEPK